MDLDWVDIGSLVAAVASTVAAWKSWKTADRALEVARESSDAATRQASVAEAANQREALTRALERLTDPRLIEARGRVLRQDIPPQRELYEESSPESWQFKINPEYQSAYSDMHLVWTSFDQLALQARLGQIPKAHLFEICPNATACWNILEQYIVWERAKLRKGHLAHFDWLRKETQRHWEARDAGEPSPFDLKDPQ